MTATSAPLPDKTPLSPASRIRRLLVQLAVLFGLYAACRLLFAMTHQNAWSVSFSYPEMLWKGLRYDASAIAMTNILFIICSLLPAPFVHRTGWQRFLKYLFIIVNGLALLFNVADIAYFPFIQKRMQFDALRFLNGQKGTDFYTLLPTFLLQYWYLIFFFGALLFLLFKGYAKSLRAGTVRQKPDARYYLFTTLLFLCFSGLSILAIRGGTQLIPINVVNAAEAAGVQDAPVLLNAPFSILTTTERQELSGHYYFADEEIKPCAKGIHLPQSTGTFRKKNVVVLLIESLSTRYVGALGGNIPTPFLDSIFKQSLSFTNGFANSRESIQGIPAVLSSIPSWQDEPYIFSAYATNRITSIPNLLGLQGYHSAFFHGGKNGTMGFDVYSGLAGYDAYFGRKEYNNDADFDGSWGIWDEPFLQFSADRMARMPQPFTAAVFTLNTHHPFKIPAQYQARFAEEGHPIRSSVRYVDFALSQFFKRAQQMPWFQNTLFIITADHASHRLEERSYHALEDYRIPIAFYTPDGSLPAGVDNRMANQIDILPTVMDYLHYPEPYFSFGNSLISPPACYPPQTISYIGGTFQATDSAYTYQFNGEKGLALYHWTADSFFSNNLLPQLQETPAQQQRDRDLKTAIQVFRQALRNNAMWVKPSGG